MPTPTKCITCGHSHPWDAACNHIMKADTCRCCGTFIRKECECREHKPERRKDA